MKFADRLKFTATGTSAATITFGAAVDKFRTLAQAIADGALTVGDTDVPFTIDDGAGNVETSLFTVTSAAVLTRTSVLSSTAGGTTPETFTGTLNVFSAMPASFASKLPIVAQDAAGNVTGLTAPNGKVLSLTRSTLNAPSWRLSGVRRCGFGLFFGNVVSYMSYTVHTCPFPIDQLKFVYSNWSPNNGNDGAGAGTLSVDAGIQYPLGAAPQVATWGGQATGTAAAGTDVESDALTLNVTIPANTPFAIRGWGSNPSGVYLSPTQVTSSGDRCQWGTGVANTVNSTGAVTNSDTTNIAPPVAVLMYHNGVAVGILGDSRTNGSGDTTAFAANERLRGRGQFERAMYNTFPYIKFGVNGEKSATITNALSPRRINLINKYCTDVIIAHMINDITLDFITLATAQSRILAEWALFPTKRIYACTLPPSTTGAWTATDGSDQTASATTPVIQAYNTWLRGQTVTDGVLDIAQVVSLPTDPTKWKAPGFTTDGLHETTQANIAILRSGLLNPGFLP